MRDNKPFTIISWKKAEEPEMVYHCAIHRSRMLRFPDGALRCTVCGGVDVAIRITDTIENKS
jgi:hypothetical protein